jgi:hypothetical protein
MPADYGLRCDDAEGELPSRPDPLSEYPEELVEGGRDSGEDVDASE